MFAAAATTALLLFLLALPLRFTPLFHHHKPPFPISLQSGPSLRASHPLDSSLPSSISTSISTVPFDQPSGVRSSERVDLFHRQWDALMLQCRIWHGVWVRLDLSGQPYIWTYAMRNFTTINETFVHQNNVYYNPLWRPAGSSPVWLLYKQNYYDPRTLNLGYHFYPQGWGLWSSPFLGRNVALAAMEKFLISGRQRVSYTPFYRNGILYRFTLVRERQHPHGVRSEEVLPIKAVQLTRPGVKLEGEWVRVHECMDEKYVYTKTYGIYEDFVVPTPIGPKRNALKHGWDISISVPTTAGLNGEVYETFFVWEVSGERVVAGTTRYGADGFFEQDCSSTFYKLDR